VTKPPKDLLDLLKNYDRGVQELALTLREVVLEELAPCFETILEVYIISLVYASSEKTIKDGICYIGVMKDRVNLGFNHGAELGNSHGLLEGTGKQMRHIKIRNVSDALNPAIRGYLQEACERAGHEVTARSRTVTTSVKRKAAPKRVVGSTRL
jgi:uncharacterized protein DUF1801